MEVRTTDTFFKSLKKLMLHETWYYKLYKLFRYDIVRFFKNILRFIKVLWDFQPWDDSYNMQVFKRTLELTADYMERYGLEVESSRRKKVVKMRRAIELLNNHINENFIEQAEKELGLKTNTYFDFVETEDHPGSYKMVDNSSEKEQENNSKIFTRARELEEEQWKELWEIIQGQGKCPDNMNWEQFFDGSGLRGWWD